MGLTVLEVEVGNPATPDTTERVEFLIDSGAIYSVVAVPILERLGISPITEQQFRLADGSKIVRKKGIALFRYGERVGGADVIFGEEGDSTLLGAFTLEALGLSLDPLRRAAALAADVSLELQRRGFPLEYVDLGGGLGVSYDGADVPSPGDYVAAAHHRLWASVARALTHDASCAGESCGRCSGSERAVPRSARRPSATRSSWPPPAAAPGRWLACLPHALVGENCGACLS